MRKERKENEESEEEQDNRKKKSYALRSHFLYFLSQHEGRR